VKSIKRAWTSTCIKLGYGTGIYDPMRRQWTQYKGKIFHDFRRTGLRNLIRAGVDRDVAMSITGHLTDNVFSRYNIVNEEDLAEAGRKVVKHMAARHMQNTNSSAANGHAVPNHEHANSAASQFGGITWGITPPTRVQKRLITD
jgi:hypothetical protein